MINNVLVLQVLKFSYFCSLHSFLPLSPLIPSVVGGDRSCSLTYSPSLSTSDSVLV